MFDCRTNRTPIEQLGSIGFDWFLVRFRSIDYVGLIVAGLKRTFTCVWCVTFYEYAKCNRHRRKIAMLLKNK